MMTVERDGAFKGRHFTSEVILWAVRGAKVRANTERYRVDPRAIGKEWLISAVFARWAAECCTCVPGLLPLLLWALLTPLMS